jgi:hypothetical protein
MKKPELDKIDFGKLFKELYTAAPKPKEVTAAKATFLSLEGTGEPGGPAYSVAIQQLYSLAYTMKFMLKHSGKLDFAVSRLECLWLTEQIDQTPMSEWRWRLLIRIPDAVTASDLKRASKEILEKRQIDVTSVKRLAWKEGRCVQMMHIGPYNEVGRSYRQLDEYAREKGLTVSCPGHEIYISDPRRVAPAKLKTIVRLPVSAAVK